ncbi:hypothetical protein BHE74_00058409, partial [Ensete ventricosum]
EAAKGGRESDGTVGGAANDPNFSNEAMERHRCKRCYRRFANGRALAGHMRSHHVVPVRLPRPFPSPSAASSSSPVAAMEAEEEKGPATYAFREKRVKSFWLADPGFSFTSAFEDRESDTESFLHRWPKRRRSVPAEIPAAEEPLSSVSDVFSEEAVARWLMLLSRDAWSTYEAEERKSNGWDEVEAEKYVEEEEEENGIGSRSRRRRSRFRCGTCRKVFRSYQALGGHRASHKRERMECVPTAAMMRIHSEDFSGASAAHHDAKLWRCPYCYRVFGSGQALGGHKRTHLSSAAAATSPAPHLPHPPSPVAAVHRNNGGRDLNLPAPSEEEPELSQQSSHASDFLSPKRRLFGGNSNQILRQGAPNSIQDLIFLKRE